MYCSPLCPSGVSWVKAGCCLSCVRRLMENEAPFFEYSSQAMRASKRPLPGREPAMPQLVISAWRNAPFSNSIFATHAWREYMCRVVCL